MSDYIHLLFYFVNQIYDKNDLVITKRYVTMRFFDNRICIIVLWVIKMDNTIVSLSPPLRALIEQLSEVICNNDLNQSELSTLLTTHEKLILDLFYPVVSGLKNTISQKDSHIKLLEMASKIQKEEYDQLQNDISELQNEIERYKSILGNNSTNSGFTRRTTLLSGAARKQDQEENKEENKAETKNTVDDIDEFGFKIAEDSEDNSHPVNTYNGRLKRDKNSTETFRQVGAQFGHKGKTLSKETAEDIIIYLKEKNLPVYNETRGITGKGNPKTCYLLGMNPAPFITKFTVYKNRDGNYDFPRGISKNPVAYDNSVYIFISYLRFECNLPQLKISSLISDFTNGIISPSVGTVNNAIDRFTSRCKNSYVFLENQALTKDVLYTDATYVFLNGKHAYIRNLSCKEFALYYGMTSKSKEALDKIATFREYDGILCHDHEVVMYHFGKNEHGECIIHVNRYCRKNSEDSKNDWSKELAGFFHNCQHLKEELIKIGLYSISEETSEYISNKYDEIILKGIDQNKSTKNKYASDREITFLRRLVKYKKSHLLFMHNFEVDWSNNLSERDLRAAKRFSLITGGFRKDKNFNDYCIGLSVTQTFHRQNIPVIGGIRWIFDNEGNVFDPAVIETIRAKTNYFMK